MKLVLQTGHPEACQHSCIAMLADVSLEDVIKFIGHDRRLAHNERYLALKHFGVYQEVPQEYLTAIFSVENEGCLGWLVMVEGRSLWCSVYSCIDTNMAHAVLVHKGQLYDPNRGLDPVWPWHYMIGSASSVTPIKV